MVPMADAHKLELPASYRERLPHSWRGWLEQVPDQVASCVERWELTIAGELPLSHSYVVAVERADGRPCVLKLQPTEVPELPGPAREVLGLRLAGPVAVEVVEEDVASGALLLERALPGTTLGPLAAQDDDAATTSLATVIRAYGRRIDTGSLGLCPFEELAEAFERFDRNPHGGIARRKAAATAGSRLSIVLGVDELGTAVEAVRSARHTAERVLAELTADPSEPHLLHGDLHHGNVLDDERRGPLVIDPWGLYGDRAADVAPALHNPLEIVTGAADVDALIRRRLAIYAEILEIDLERLTAWCYVYVAIRALWAIESNAELPDDDARVRTVTALRRLI